MNQNRYYEFLVLDKKSEIKGSILIPIYKRTEYYFTSEVRKYKTDEKTYKAYPTKWGKIASLEVIKLTIQDNSNIDKAFTTIYDDLLKRYKITDYTIYHKQLSEESTNKKLLPIKVEKINSILADIFQLEALVGNIYAYRRSRTVEYEYA